MRGKGEEREERRGGRRGQKGRDEGEGNGAPIEMKAPNQNPKYATGC